MLAIAGATGRSVGGELGLPLALHGISFNQFHHQGHGGDHEGKN